ncbi:MAG: hypothetical protein ACLRFG_00990 [Clostridia bacterium]
MTTKIKSNTLVLIFCLAFIAIFVTNPSVYMQSTLKGLNVWLNAIVPSLFPFFFASKLLTNALPPFRSASTNIFLISIVSGYPVGAKLLADKCKNGEIDADYCTRALALCSTSGPLFLLGSVGIGIFHSYKAGIILLVSHIIGSILNGLIYRRKTATNLAPLPPRSLNLGDTMYDSIVSLLLVGGFITLSFVMVDMLVNIGLIDLLARLLTSIFHTNFDSTKAVLCGLIEMTRGCIEVQGAGINISTSLILCSGLVGFAGVSVFLQTVCFLPPSIKRKRIILQKITQAILCMLVCALICMIFY